ncbi:MAG: response regulator [Firmicutes bacterium]|nr:response regulator [Blautia sp.]MDD7371782.1 response regulator [Bacillota bacterium]MDY3714816.1 response regulator [Blautia sp.]
MFRTLLVDDDFLVRTYLKTLSSWERAGYEITQDVQDGEEALDVMKQKEIDVVITDISMPVMDGIELIRHIRQEMENIYIIVLSCHDDFEYVKEAMRLGADEYVLKNALDEENLYEVLNKSKKQIENRKEKTSEQIRNKKLLKIGSHTMKYHFFNGILSRTLSGKEREKKRKEAGIIGKYGNSAVIVMFLHDWNRKKNEWSPLEEEQYSQTFRHGLIHMVQQYFPEESDYGEIIYLGAGVFCCFLDLSLLCRDSIMRQRLMDMASICFRHCEKEPCSFGICVSSICMGEDGICQAYQQARKMMKYSFYDPSDILYYDHELEVSQHLPQEAERLYEQIELWKNSGKKQMVEDAWVRVIEGCQREHTDGRVLIQWLKQLDKRVGIRREPEEYMQISSLEQLKETGKKFVNQIFAEEERTVPEGICSTVKTVLEFIHCNYKNQISLPDAAEAADVNPTYLSYLFKQEMQIGFSNYLQECRMKCAKELLRNTNCKIKDVASMAGFNDYHYFSKTFKKLNHCSPADYRKQQ